MSDSIRTQIIASTQRKISSIQRNVSFLLKKKLSDLLSKKPASLYLEKGFFDLKKCYFAIQLKKKLSFHLNIMFLNQIKNLFDFKKWRFN